MAQIHPQGRPSESTGNLLLLFRRRAFGSLAVFTLGSALLLSVALAFIRRETVASSERYVLSLSQLVAEQTSRSLQSVSQALELAQSQLQELEAANRLDESTARTRLRQRLQELPFVRAIWFMDAQGAIRFDSDEGNIGVSLVDRDYFNVHLRSDLEFYVGLPVKSRSVGTWLVSASRPWRDRQGRLNGVLAAAIEPPYFDQLWQTVSVGDGGSISLFKRDGILMMRSPFPGDVLGENYSDSLGFMSRLGSSATGTYVATSPLDHQERLVAYRALENFPEFVVVTGMEMSVLLQPWYRVAAFSITMWLLTITAAVALTLLWLRELDKRRRMEDRTEQARRMESIGTLAGGVAHDFNNVLAAMLGHLQLARQEIPASSAAHASLRLVEESGERARLIVQQILAFSRGVPQHLKRTSLLDIVRESLRMLRPTLPSHTDLITKLPDEPVEVVCDATQIQQILLNLCTNSSHAVPVGAGRIEVGVDVLGVDAAKRLTPEWKRNGPAAHLWVADNGPGIPIEYQDKVLEPFFTTKPRGMGTGLGLSLVQRIASEHGGLLKIQSKADAGCAVHVLLPLHEFDQSISQDEEKDAGENKIETGRGHGQNVLCIDDDEVILLMLEGILKAGGFQVTTCQSPQEAIDLFVRYPAKYQVVVTDFDMPSMSGIAVAREILALQPGLVVVLQSGYVTEQLQAEASALGIKAVLNKENAWRQLSLTIAELLQSPSD
ncbi:ATP-binding protein [Azohydromonas lata]|uniref:ATP-binding protein n=1 Tax=Azohydromonas lata TaxID=45677 RepID=UPI000A02681E|nr:cache domain-containing protein [Azohydromonas lata]